MHHWLYDYLDSGHALIFYEFKDVTIGTQFKDQLGRWQVKQATHRQIQKTVEIHNHHRRKYLGGGGTNLEKDCAYVEIHCISARVKKQL